MGLVFVYHGFSGGGGSWVYPLYIIALSGWRSWNFVVVNHGFRCGGAPGSCRCI